MVIRSDTFIFLISWFMKPSAIALWPFIIISPKRIHKKFLEKTINHEKIHLAQQKELLLLGFYILYLYFYVKNYLSYNHKEAYFRIPFEREAYLYESDFSYLKKRKKFKWKEWL